MATLDYKTAKYDPTYDYQAAYNKNLALGKDANSPIMKGIQLKRAAKIYNDPNLMKTQGSTISPEIAAMYGMPAPATTPTPTVEQPPATIGTAANTDTTPAAGIDYSAIAEQLRGMMPQQEQYKAPDYQGKYDKNIMAALEAITNRKPFTYDPTKDEGLKSAQSQVMDAVARAGARRNMLYNKSTGYGMEKAAMEAIPQFQQASREQYNTEGQGLYNQLSALQGMDANEFARYQAGVQNKQYEDTTQYNRAADITNKAIDIGNTVADRAINEAYITGEYKGKKTITAKQLDMQAEQSAWEKQFEIGKFDYTKIRDSVADQQYKDSYNLQLDEYMWNKNPDNPTIKAQILANQINDLELKNLPAKYKLQIDQLTQDLETGKLSQEQIKANIANIKKSTANIGKSSGSGSSSKDYGEIGYKDYLSAGRDMLKKTYNSDAEDWVTPYTTDQVKEWALGLPLDDVYQAKLLSDLGISKPAKQPEINYEYQNPYAGR